jgi:hypothetical protein
LVLVASLFAARDASAQVDAQIAELNSQALEAYQALDIDQARGKLEQAIGLAQQSGLAGPPVAQTYMNLAVVYVAGMNDRDQGLTAFVAAVCMQPNIQLDPLLSTPDVQQVFTQAQQDAQRGACGPAGPAPPAGVMPQAMPGMVPGPGAAAQYGYAGPRTEDTECPPGVKCDAPGTNNSGPTDFARGFVNLQMVAGLALVRPGMKADSKPKDYLSEVFTPQAGPPEADTNMDGKIDTLDAATTRYVFNTSSAWVPDADSFDDYEDATLGIPRGITALSGKCPGDGKRSGPIDTLMPVKDPATNQPYTTMEPSSYCVRVEAPGMVPNLAMRLNPGYFISHRFALSMPLRIQFSAGKGSLSHLLIGARGEYLFSKMDKATGVPISWFFGATIGQIQAKPPPKDPKRASPYAISGPFGLHTGVNIRVRVHRNFGLIFSPELDLQVPDLMFNVDLAGGVEGAF